MTNKVYRENLKALYNEVMPRYELLKDKIEEINERMNELTKLTEEAKVNYDVEKMMKYTTERETLDEIAKQVRKDLNEYIEELHRSRAGYAGLNSRVQKAYEDDFEEENKSEDIQRLFLRRTEINNELQEIEKELTERYQQVTSTYVKEIGKFKALTNRRGNCPTGASIVSFWLDEKKE